MNPPMTDAEFRFQVHKIMAKHLLAEHVDRVTDTICEETEPANYTDKLIELQESFDWSTTD